MTKTDIQTVLDALEQITTSETFFKDSRGDTTGPLIDLLQAALAEPSAAVAIVGELCEQTRNEVLRKGVAVGAYLFTHPATSKPEPSEPFSKVLQSATNYDGTWSALVTAPCWLPTGLPLFTHPASSNHLDEISKVLHYPDCWDTAAYPTLEDAIIEAKSWAHCTNEDCQCPTKDA